VLEDAGPSWEGEPFAAEVVRVDIGEGGGFGEAALPGIVLGPPLGAGQTAGSVDVLSLGAGGVIELRLGVDVVDGEGADLIVFENAFEGAGLVFGEPGRLSVSADGESWTDFPCDASAQPPNGCAGYEPVFAQTEEAALDVEGAGGDAFDLALVGVARARFVRITSMVGQANGEDGKAGFDLDAVAVLNAGE
jgi:hypothetical protein